MTIMHKYVKNKIIANMLVLNACSADEWDAPGGAMGRVLQVKYWFDTWAIRADGPENEIGRKFMN